MGFIEGINHVTFTLLFKTHFCNINVPSCLLELLPHNNIQEKTSR